MKIVGELKSGMELDIKRCYLPGLKLVGKCPGCGKKHVRDFAQHYLLEPRVGPVQVHCYCEDCDHEWHVDAKLTVTLELVPEAT